MTGPLGEADPADVQEQRETLTRDAAVEDAPDIPDDVPVADALEQSVAAAPGEHLADRTVPAEADEADALEQAVVVEREDDEVRD